MKLSDQEFIHLVRSLSPLGDSEASIALESTLSDLGFDSFGKVQLLLAVEREYCVELPEEALTIGTFLSVGTLWAAVQPLL